MKNLGNMLKQAQEMQGKMQEMQAELEALEIEGVSGGGMVKVILTGKSVLKRVTIDPTLMKPEDAEMVEDLPLERVEIGVHARSKGLDLGASQQLGCGERVVHFTKRAQRRLQPFDGDAIVDGCAA